MLAVPPKSNGMCAPHKSCVWTSARGHGVVVAMDDDTSDLVVPLCTRIGMIMEDASPVALKVACMDVAERKAALAELDQSIEQLGSLIDAAKVLQQ